MKGWQYFSQSTYEFIGWKKYPMAIEMIKSYKFIRGYVRVCAEGRNIERFLNMAIKRKIFIWDVKRNDNVEFFVSNKGYSIMEKIAYETGVGICIISHHGASEVLLTYKNRKTFFILAAAILLAIFISSSFIWEISVEKQDYIDEELIKNKLSEYNLKQGALRKSFDSTMIANDLVTEFPEILWSAVELSGTRIIVRLAPRKPAPPVIPKNVPTNIIAKNDASIVSIITENGDAKVREGDTVIKGQILISGAIPTLTEGTRYLHSQGRIDGITWYEKKLPQKLYIYNKIKTGNTIKKRYILLPFIKIPLQLNETIDFNNYDSIIKEEHWFFISHKEFTYEEYNLKRENISKEAAMENAVLEILDGVKNEGITNIISQKISHEEIDDENINVRVLLECREEIGVETEIMRE